MAGAKTTSLELEFSSDSNIGEDIVLEKSDREPDFGVTNQSFFRVHSKSSYVVNSSSGSVSKADSNLRKFTSEFVYFENSMIEGIRYPGALKVDVSAVGDAFDADNNRVNPRYRFDIGKNAIVTDDIPVYGVVLVEYEAPFDMWRMTFSGLCPSVETYNSTVLQDGAGPDDDIPYEGLDPTVVYARIPGNESVSLALDPPPCEYGGNSSTSRKQQDVDTPRLVVEEDDKEPIRLLNRSKRFPEGGGRLRIYPNDPRIALGTSSGEIGTERRSGTRYVKETITFSGGSTATTKYPPGTTAIDVRVVSQSFVDVWGRTFEPSVRLWGDSITSVVWNSKYSTSNPIRRSVLRGEVAIGNMFGKAIECYGALELTYVTSYFSVEYDLIFDGSNREFKEATVVAYLDQQTATYAVSRPRIAADY